MNRQHNVNQFEFIFNPEDGDRTFVLDCIKEVILPNKLVVAPIIGYSLLKSNCGTSNTSLHLKIFSDNAHGQIHHFVVSKASNLVFQLADLNRGAHPKWDEEPEHMLTHEEIMSIYGQTDSKIINLQSNRVSQDSTVEFASEH